MDGRDRLNAEADGYARLALENIGREFPTYVSVLMQGPGEFPSRPREWTPVFFGSFDWHSCVEMHWVLVRLLKVAPDAVPASRIRAALDGQFTAAGLRAEAQFMAERGSGQRPYSWGWALTLAHEHEGGWPTCLTGPGTAHQVTFGWVPVTLPDGGSYRQVVWVDCRS